MLALAGRTHIPDARIKTGLDKTLTFLSHFCLVLPRKPFFKGKSIQCERCSKYFLSLDYARGMAIEPSLTPIEHTEKIRAWLESQGIGPLWALLGWFTSWIFRTSVWEIHLPVLGSVHHVNRQKYSCPASLKSSKHIWHMLYHWWMTSSMPKGL